MIRALLWTCVVGWAIGAGAQEKIEPFMSPPAEFAGKLGDYRSPLKFEDGAEVRTAAEWGRRRGEILAKWHGLMGPWPAVIERPKLEIVESAAREDFTQHKVRVEVAAGNMVNGYLLVPKREGGAKMPAVFIPYYEPETSIGLSPPAKGAFRDYGYQLAKRGFVTLSIGSPGGDARKPEPGRAAWQPR
jgi:hypothetical protein